MPDQLFSLFKTKIKKIWLYTFFSAIIIGIITHLFVFTNRLPNHDSMFNIYNTQAKVKSGRFFLGPASGMSSYFDLPWVIGVLSLLFLALTAVTIVILFKIQKNSSAILIAGIVVTFPSVSATFSYLFTADGYILGMFFAILAVLLTISWQYGFLIGAVFLALTVGIYQAGLSTFLAYTITWLIYSMLIIGISSKELWKQGVRLSLTTVIGMGMYYTIFKIYSSLMGGFITDYQGLDKVGSLTIHDIPSRILQMREKLESFFFPSMVSNVPLTLYDYINVIVITLVILITISFIIKKQFYKKIDQFLMFALLIIALPFVYFIVYFISPLAFYHMLMVFSISTLYVYLVLLYDALPAFKANILEKSMAWVILATLSIMIWNFNIIANITYFNMEMRYEKSLAVSNRVLDRIEQLDNYLDIKEIAVSGRVQMSSELSSVTIPQRTPDMIGSTGEMFLLGSYHYKVMLEDFLGKRIEAASTESLDAIKQTETFKTMPLWPAKDSVKVFGSIVVVKFSE